MAREVSKQDDVEALLGAIDALRRELAAERDKNAAIKVATARLDAAEVERDEARTVIDAAHNAVRAIVAFDSALDANDVGTLAERIAKVGAALTTERARAAAAEAKALGDEPARNLCKGGPGGEGGGDGK